MTDTKSSGFGTRAIHGGQAPEATTGAIMTPIFQTSTYVQPGPGDPIDGYDYARLKNPTREAMEAKGYTEGELDSSDLVISLQGAVIPTINVQPQHGVNYGYNHQSAFWGSNYPSMTFGVTTDIEKDANDIATLVLEIYESEGKQMVWVGWVSGKRANKPVEPEVLKERLASILASFPGK